MEPEVSRLVRIGSYNGAVPAAIAADEVGARFPGGSPMVLNTSFNENEPIVLRPQEALNCFLRTDMDVVVLGGYMVRKAESHEEQVTTLGAEECQPRGGANPSVRRM